MHVMEVSSGRPTYEREEIVVKWTRSVVLSVADNDAASRPPTTSRARYDEVLVRPSGRTRRKYFVSKGLEAWEAR